MFEQFCIGCRALENGALGSEVSKQGNEPPLRFERLVAAGNNRPVDVTSGIGRKALAQRLARIGASRQAVDTALSSLSGGAGGVKTIDGLGFVVSGVNDAPAEGDAFADAAASIDGSGSAASTPLSPAMLADQRAREARYGLGVPPAGQAAAALGAPASAAGQPTASGRPRIFDASEGTKLDPLLNKTYDLSYAKVVPTRR